jgi:putative transposase
MNAVAELSPEIGVAAAARALGIPRATLYRWKTPSEGTGCAPRAPRRVPRRLTEEERVYVLTVLHSDEFADMAPAAIYATLLDRDTYLCSTRTMYRLLHDHDEVKERRDQRRHPKHAKPELVATAPNRVWSWDITKLPGPRRGIHYSLYVILDIFSRYVVAWTVAHGEDAVLAKDLIAQACLMQKIQPGQLTIHADRGSSMRSKPVACLLEDLEVARSHSRPRTSDDNPFSESQFKTLKYRPEFPERFGAIEDGRLFCRGFFDWYNRDHRHSGIAMLTPHVVHHGHANDVLEGRQNTLAQAYAAHPERFPGGPPTHGRLREEVWINQPISASTVTAQRGRGLDGIATEEHVPIDR